MKVKIIGLLIVSLFCKTAFAQSIKIEGKVKDNQQTALSSATLQLKDQNSAIIAYTFTNTAGTFSLNATLNGTQKVYLIASYLGFKKDTLFIDATKLKTNVINHDFTLQPDANQLKEISIEAPKQAIIEINDTTKYNVGSFTSLEDRNLEAVIKKMPGMEVSKDGTIYFKNKQISKVLLENDDLTGDNYKAITQNLKPDLVNEVQAIEHWVEDDLLKGIINSDDIVLNLTLKDKRKQKLIGSVDAAYGNNDRNDFSTNLITFVNKTKAYGFVRNNNIGSSQENIFKIAGANRTLFGDGKLINHQIITLNPFDGNALALNNSLNGSINTVTRFSPAFKMSNAIYGLRNTLYADNQTSSIYYAPINAVTLNQQSQKTNNKHYQADLNADYLIAKNARFTAKLSYVFRPHAFNGLAFSTYNSVVGNEVNQFQNDKLSNYNADLKYTFKANVSSALIVSAKIAQNSILQDYNPTSGLYQTLALFNGANNLLQTVSTNNTLVKFDAQALKKYGKNYFYANVGTEYNRTILQSNLLNNQNQHNINGFLNDNNFNVNKVYLAGKYTYDNKKVVFQSFLKASLINQKAFNTDTTFLALEPDVKLSAKLSTFQNISFRYNYNYTLANALDFYSMPILTDLRSVNTGLNRIYNYGNHNFNINYSNNELNDRYFSFNLGANGQFSEGGFLTNNFFENTFYYTQKTPYKGIRNFSGNVGVQKFLPVLYTKLAVNYVPAVSNFYGKVASQINNYTATSQMLNTTLSTGFNLPINFSLEFQYQNSATRQMGNLINNQSNYKYGLQSRYQLNKKMFSLIDFNWYKLNGQNYKLLNAELQFNPTKGRFKYAVYGKNLLNVKSINYNFVSNVDETTSSTSILGRYVLGSVSMSIK